MKTQQTSVQGPGEKWGLEKWPTEVGSSLLLGPTTLSVLRMRMVVLEAAVMATGTFWLMTPLANRLNFKF